MFTGDRFISQRDNDSATLFAAKCELFPSAFDRTSNRQSKENSNQKPNENTKAYQSILFHEVLRV